MNKEIAAIAAKARLPGLRYLSFGNAPLRRWTGIGHSMAEIPASSELAKEAIEQRMHEHHQAGAPPAGDAEVLSAVHPYAPFADGAPAFFGGGRPALPRSWADAAGAPPAGADFLLLRAVEEQLARTACARNRCAGEVQTCPSDGHAAPVRATFRQTA